MPLPGERGGGYTPTVRIAHVSDLHLLAHDDIPLSRFLNKRFTGLMNLKLKRSHKHRPAHLAAVLRRVRAFAPDHVVITGDLTNLALEPEFEAVRALIETELAMSPKDVSVVPGNHDLYTRGALRTQRFTDYFREYIQSDLAPGSIALGPFPYVKLRGAVAFIGLSSAVPRLPLIASGELGAGQREALVRILEHPEVRSRTPVILMHHPPHNPASQSKAFAEGLHDSRLLLGHLVGLRRGLVLHGHLHRRLAQRIADDVTSVGATSASLHHDDADRMAGFNAYEIDDATGEIGAMTAHVYAPDAPQFSERAIPAGTWH
jgi:3',5'-cyclic AMP phosphodiesterase CpdA